MRQYQHVNKLDNKAASYALKPNGVYVGEVVSINNGLPSVKVRGLGCTIKDVGSVGRTNLSSLSVGDSVLCTFINQETQQLYILGTTNIKTDVFASKEKFNALIDQIESLLSLASNALDAFKQT